MWPLTAVIKTEKKQTEVVYSRTFFEGKCSWENDYFAQGTDDQCDGDNG